MSARMMKPDMERALNRSSSGGVLPGFGFDWSCGSQLALVKGVVVLGESGKWRNESRCSFRRLEK
eukprot:6087993-Ditylum_brightwellii.AAC.1